MGFRKFAIRLATGLFVLTPFAIAIAAHAMPDRQDVPPVSERTALSFGEYLVNLGRLAEGKPAGAIFRFTNTGDKPLKILDFAPSCGCLTPRLEKMDYQPGEQGRFVVVADTAGEGSDKADSLKQHYVDVRYHDGTGEKRERVHVKFVLPARRVQIAPRALLIYQGNDQPTTREIIVTDRRASPITIRSVECSSPLAKLEAELAETMDDPQRAKISLTVVGAPSGMIETRVLIHTDDPEQPVLYVPLVIHGPEENAGAENLVRPLVRERE